MLLFQKNGNYRTLQFYNNNKNIPAKIFTSIEISEKNLLEKALEIQNKNKVIIRVPNTTSNIKIIEEGLAKAKKNLADKISKNSNIRELHAQIKKIFNLSNNIYVYV